MICLAYSLDGGPPSVWLPAHGKDTGLWNLAHDPDVIFIAHNATFEKAIWRRQMVEVHGWPDIPNKRWADTQAVCAMRVIPQDLDMAVRTLGLAHEKDLKGSALTKGLSKPNCKGYFEITPAVLQQVYDYNRQDIRATVDLHQRLGFLPPAEREVWLLDQRINERGVCLDMEYVRNCQRIVDRATVPLTAEFEALTGIDKVTKGAKLMAWVKDQGVTLPNLQKETLAPVLAGNAEDDDDDGESDPEPSGSWDDEVGSFGDDVPYLPPNVHRALAIRSLIGSASIKKLARMRRCVCSDGRARGLLQYHGTGPGLWAGRLFQPQNFPRGTIKLGKEAPPADLVISAINTGDAGYVEALLGPPVEVVVSALRHTITASPGRLLVAGDFAGIQARTVLALAGQHDKTALMAAGKDIYLDMAEAIYQERGLTKADLAKRQTGKNAVLGLGFQMGARKFRFRYAKTFDLEFAEGVVQAYRKTWAPLVPKVWYGLEAAALRAVWDHKRVEAYGITYELEDGWLTARLPSGRKLWYFDPTPSRKAMPWDADDVRQSWTYLARKQGRPRVMDAFGGLLTENVVMGMQRDLMTAAMFKCEANGMPVVLNVHDEIILEVPAGRDSLAALIQIMEDRPRWAVEMQIPVAVEGWTGERYKK